MPSKEIQEVILNRAITEIKNVLEIATAMKIQTFILDRAADDYQKFEAETFHLAFTKLAGTGIIATRSALGNSESRINDEFFHDDVPLSNHQTS